MVRDVLAANEGQALLLCVGGCGGDTVILDRPQAAVASVYVPSSSKDKDAKPEAAAEAPASPARDVVCVAGCAGAKGAAVWKPVRQSEFAPPRKTETDAD